MVRHLLEKKDLKSIVIGMVIVGLSSDKMARSLERILPRMTLCLIIVKVLNFLGMATLINEVEHQLTALIQNGEELKLVRQRLIRRVVLLVLVLHRIQLILLLPSIIILRQLIVVLRRQRIILNLQRRPRKRLINLISGYRNLWIGLKSGLVDTKKI